jgi:phosphosulfolactate synthase
VVPPRLGGRDGGRPGRRRPLVIAEGRESGNVALFAADGQVREQLVEAIAARLQLERVIFEAPRKAQ